MHRNHGLTLIELLIVLVIVSILAAIAIPSYRGYVQRSNRAAAKSVMMNIASQQEQFFVDRKRYATALSQLGYAADTLFADGEGNLDASQQSDSIYQITLAGYDAAGIANCSVSGSPNTIAWTLVATPVGGQADDTHCAKLCLAYNGQRGASGSGSDCWSR